MKTYKLSFVGRQAGAIGIIYPIYEAYKAKDIHEAMSLLYEDYDSIGSLKIEQGNKKIKVPENIKWVQVRSNRDRPRKADRATYL